MADVVYEFTPGDDFIINMNLTDPQNANAPVDISTWTIESAVMYSRAVLSTCTVTIVDGPLGQFQISVPRSETAGWPQNRDLHWSVQFTRPTDGRVSSPVVIIRTLKDPTP